MQELKSIQKDEFFLECMHLFGGSIVYTCIINFIKNLKLTRLYMNLNMSRVTIINIFDHKDLFRIYVGA